MKRTFVALSCVLAGYWLCALVFKTAEASGVLAIPPTVMQTNKSNTVTTGTQNFAAAIHTLPVIVAANVGALPATGCTSGELAVVTAATIGQQIYENSGSGACVWTQQLDTGSSNGGGVSVYSNFSAQSIGTSTEYIAVGGGVTPNSTEANVQTASSSVATITNLFVQVEDDPGTSNTLTFTWRKNGSSQSLTCTVTGSGGGTNKSCSDATHSFSVSQGDLLSIRVDAVRGGALISLTGIMVMTQFGTTQAGGTVNSGTQNQTAGYAANGTTVSGSSNLSIRAFGGGFDGGGVALTAGKTVYVTVPYACTIAAYNITADTGTVSFDIWKIATGTAIPTVANTIISGSNYLSLSSGTAVHSTTTSGFTTTTVSANDILGINIQAVSSATLLNLVIQCNATAT